LTDRVMVHWKYLKLDRSPNEHMLITSEEDNDELLEKHFHGTKDEKSFVLARTFLCAYWIKPVYEGQQIVGSTIRYMFSGDIGGSVPAMVQNTVGPKTAFDSVKGLIDYVEKKRRIVETVA
jgi:hypothetical protein